MLEWTWGCGSDHVLNQEYWAPMLQVQVVGMTGA